MGSAPKKKTFDTERYYREIADYSEGEYHHEEHKGNKEEFDYYPAALRRHITDGVSPVESRSITPQGGEAVALPFGQTRGFKLCVRYNLIVKPFVIFVYFVVDKFYIVLQEPSLPLGSRSPWLSPNSETVLVRQIAGLTLLHKSAKNPRNQQVSITFISI
jgi:hypothetical protein